jgi:hypothetical protein
MAYTLKITATRGADTQWIAKPDGSPIRTSTGVELVFVVKSNYKDSISSDEFLKQTGNIWKKGIGKPSDIRDRNGWKVELI